MTYDSILIGTSPISILEAIYLRRSGKKVLLIDKSSSTGGAWGTLSIGNFSGIEYGCHIWDIDQPTYQFIEKILGVQLKKLNPQPKLIKNGRALPYDWKNISLNLKEIKKSIKKKDYSRAWNAIKKLRIVPADYFYPPLGSIELINVLNELVQKESIDIQLNTSALSINQLDSEVIVQTSNDQEIKAKQLVLTSCSKVNNLLLNDKPFQLQSYLEVKYTHVHFLVECKSLPKSFSYLRIMDDPIIHRISNMTEQLQSTDKNLHLICVGVFDDAIISFDKADLENIILEKLQKLRLITNTFKVLNTKWNTYPVSYLGEDNIELIHNSLPQVKVLRSTNFIYGLSNHVSNWKDAF